MLAPLYLLIIPANMTARSILGLLYTLKSMEALGVDLTPIMKHHGLDFNTMDANAIIDRSQELMILMDAQHQSHDELLGLKVGQNFGLAGYGPLSLLLMTSANAMEACQLGVRYQEMAYIFGTLSMELDSKDLLLSLNIEPAPLPSSIKRFMVDRDMAGMHKMVEDMATSLGQTIQVKGIHLPYPKPKDTRPYEQRFNCPVNWDADKSSIIIRPTDLQAQFPQANKMAQDLYRSQCEQQLKRQQSHGEQLHHKVMHYLSLFNHQYPNILQVSKYLHISERTLRRRLNEQNTNFQALLDQVRYEKSQQLLQQSQVSIDEIADKLGFSEAAAFNHAFLRWSGLSPGKWRKENQL